MFQFDTALNLLWALFCVAALVFHVRSERQRTRAGSGKARVIRAVAVFVAAVSLFPCVSASDDSVRFEYLGSTQGAPSPLHPNQSKENPGKSLATLVRLLETLESVQVPLIWALWINLCFFALVLVEWRKGQDRMAPRRFGRAPPTSIVLARFS